MARRGWETPYVWTLSFLLHALGVAATGLMAIDFRRLPEERTYHVTRLIPQAECFLEPEVRLRDLSYRNGRAVEEDPDPQPCLEACDTMTRSVRGTVTSSSLLCFSHAPGVYSLEPRLRRSDGDPGTWPRRHCRSSVPTEGAVIPALRWLARHQNADGGWSADGFSGCCAGVPCFGSGRSEFDEGVTSLAVIAFLGAGYSPLSKDTYTDPADPGRPIFFGETVKKGVKWLMSRQDDEGCLGPRGPKFLYNHCLATLALCEVYGMTASGPLQDPSQKAVNFLVAARNPGAGWRYGLRDGETDTSVTGWALMALKSAELSELVFPRTAVNEPMAWLNGATQAGSLPAIAYRVADDRPSTIPRGPVIFADHPTMTAVGIFCAGLQSRPRALAPGLVGTLMEQPPVWAPGRVDYHYWYFGTSAIANHTAVTGPMWTTWASSLKKALVEHQRTSAHGCENGSWDSAPDRWGAEGGRVYATAINALTLVNFYRRRSCVFTPSR